MAVSEIIGAAVGVILLVLVAYVVVGSTLFAAETMANTQKDLTLQQEARLRTALVITNQFNATTQSWVIYANITNTGTEIISDFKHMDVIVYDKETGSYGLCTYDKTGGTAGTWNIENTYGEFIHPNELDPGEKFHIRITSRANQPKWFQITTANGVYASALL
jgi:archaeal flagellar protein FlaF